MVEEIEGIISIRITSPKITNVNNPKPKKSSICNAKSHRPQTSNIPGPINSPNPTPPNSHTPNHNKTTQKQNHFFPPPTIPFNPSPTFPTGPVSPLSARFTPSLLDASPTPPSNPLLLNWPPTPSATPPWTAFTFSSPVTFVLSFSVRGVSERREGEGREDGGGKGKGWAGDEGGKEVGRKARGGNKTFGSITSFILPEPSQILVFKPGDVGVVSGVVLLFDPFCHFENRREGVGLPEGNLSYWEGRRGFSCPEEKWVPSDDARGVIFRKDGRKKVCAMTWLRA